MKHILFKISFILMIGLTVFSCSDFLEMEPINQTYGEGFWTSEASANQALAGGYALLRTSLLSGNKFHTWGELIEMKTTKSRTLTNQEKFQDGSFWNPNMAEFMWNDFYKMIAQCNMIIDEVGNMDEGLFANGEAGKQKILGEAYFLRAYAYFYMTKVWGGVPLVTEPTRTVKQYITDEGGVRNIGRSPESVVLEQCIADLAIAEGYLEYGTRSSNEWAVRANKGSVQALQAHVYLWMGDADKSQQAAGNAITNGGYSLVDYSNANAVADMFNGRSSEGIFELNINYDQSESYTNGMAHLTLIHPYIVNRTETQINLRHMVKADMLPLYEATDLRLVRFFDYLDRQRPIILKYAGVVYEDFDRLYNPHGTNNIMLFRLSGIVLLRAEALAKMGRYNDARTLLNQIRTRAQASPFTGPDSDLKMEIFRERKRELIGEGHVYFDRIRGDIWEDIFWMTQTRKADQGYYWPVAGNFIINNPMIDQNPHWSKKNW